MLVDLTQYFNGNQTLINSITYWDDLAAYDPSFASYVAYNTGTVKGVQPTVKVNHTTDVACPVELFGVGSIADEYEAVTGILTKKVEGINFGSLDWTYDSAQRFVSSTLPMTFNGGWSNKNLMTSSAKYYWASDPVNPHYADGALAIHNNKIYLYDSRYTDAATVKAAQG